MVLMIGCAFLVLFFAPMLSGNFKKIRAPLKRAGLPSRSHSLKV